MADGKKNSSKKFDFSFFDYAKYKGHTVKDGRVVGLNPREYFKLKRKFYMYLSYRSIRNGYFQLERLNTQRGLTKSVYKINKDVWSKSAGTKATKFFDKLFKKSGKNKKGVSAKGGAKNG